MKYIKSILLMCPSQIPFRSGPGNRFYERQIARRFITWRGVILSSTSNLERRSNKLSWLKWLSITFNKRKEQATLFFFGVLLLIHKWTG
jgi:hypothetical protein